MYLGVSLSGSALKILETVDALVPDGYERLLEALERRYQPPDQVSLYRAPKSLWGTGASVSLLSRGEWERVRGPKELQKSDMKVTCADGRPIWVEGTAVVNINFGQCQLLVKVIVAVTGHGGILGMDALRAWGGEGDGGRTSPESE